MSDSSDVYGYLDIDGSLSNVGVVNSLDTTDLAVDMVWSEESCNIDLHVIEPNGFEIFSGAPQCPNTGKLTIVDHAQSSLDYGIPLHIENISWTSASKGCYRIKATVVNGCSGVYEYVIVFLLINGERKLYDTLIDTTVSYPQDIATFTVESD